MYHIIHYWPDSDPDPQSPTQEGISGLYTGVGYVNRADAEAHLAWAQSKWPHHRIELDDSEEQAKQEDTLAKHKEVYGDAETSESFAGGSSVVD